MDLSVLLVASLLADAPSGEGKPAIPPFLLSRIEKASEQKHPDWMLADTASMGRLVIKYWKPRKAQSAQSAGSSSTADRVSVQRCPYGTAEEASQELRKSIYLISAPMTGPIDDIGDEAYLWANYGPGGASSIRWRYGRLVVVVSGPTLEVVQGFTDTLAKELDAYAVEQRLRSTGDTIDPVCFIRSCTSKRVWTRRVI
jgi:hypothetical protein